MRKIVFNSSVNPSASVATIALHGKGAPRPFARVARVNGAWQFQGNGTATGGVLLLRIPHASVPLAQAINAFRDHVEQKLAKQRGV